MVAEILKKWGTPALRKYVSDHNKIIRSYIGKEIKEARVQYSQKLKVKRRELKAAQEINIKGKKKNEIIQAMLKEPTLMNRIKGDLNNKRAPAGFHYMEGGIIMKGETMGGGGAAAKKEYEPKKSNLKTVTKEDIKELGIKKKQKKIRIKVEEDNETNETKEKKKLPQIPKYKGKTIDPNAPEPPKRKVKKSKILPETPKPKVVKKKILPKKPLTVTRADGSVSILKKRVIDKRSILDRKKPKKEEFEKELKIALEYGNEIKKLKEKYSVKILKDLYSKPDGKNKKVELGKLITKDFKEVIAERKKLLKKTKDNEEIKKIMDKAFEEIEKIRDNVFDIPVELKMPKKSEEQVKKEKEEKEAFGKAIKPKEEPAKPKAKPAPKREKTFTEISKRRRIQAKVKALGKKKVEEKRELAGKIEKTAKALKKKPKKPPSKELIEAKKQAKQKAKDDEEKREKELKGQKKIKAIDEIPSNIKKVWLLYMDNEYGGEPYTQSDQKTELQDLKDYIEEYYEGQSDRKNKDLKAAEQMDGLQQANSVADNIKERVEEIPELKKLFKFLFPPFFKKVFPLKTKKQDKEDE